MRFLTAEADYVLSVFDRCYERRATPNGATFERVAFPRAGGALDQDNRLMELLEVARAELTGVVAEQYRRRKFLKTDAATAPEEASRRRA